jgi:hypothetical protein
MRYAVDSTFGDSPRKRDRSAHRSIPGMKNVPVYCRGRKFWKDVEWAKSNRSLADEHETTIRYVRQMRLLYGPPLR